MNNKLIKPLPAQKDFFVCDVKDIVPKGDIGAMENPIFSLSNRDMRTLEYVNGKNWLKVIPSEIGLATIFDRDVLIYCISEGVRALNAGQPINRTMRFIAYNLLTATNRNNFGGSGYKSLENALDRLTGTRLKTNIKNGTMKIKESFHLLDGYKIITRNNSGRMAEIEVKLPDWFLDAIYSKHVLTYNPNYFTLRRPIDRKLYEIMRKHCARNPQGWSIRLSTLFEKTGSKSNTREFKRLIAQSATDNKKENYMPDYNFSVEEGNPNPMIMVEPKPEMLQKSKKNKQRSQTLNLKPQTIEIARQYHGDVHSLKYEWLEWAQKLPNKIDNPDGHFLAFVKKKVGNQFA